MDDSEIKYYLLGKGTWRDLLPRLPQPVFAFGANRTYWVMVHGDGFALPVGDSGHARGFFAARFVAAPSAHDAKRIAVALVEAEWQRRGHRRAAGPATLSIEDLDLLSERFRLRSATGFTFYTEAGKDEGG